ncbi:hypothetical protein C0J52_27664, partial [Blattella germanica]
RCNATFYLRYCVFGIEGQARRSRRLRTRSHENQILAASPVHLNSSVAARLDLSCLLGQRRGRGLLKAPELPNTSGAKYTRRKNAEKPFNRYLVAMYKCDEGYALLDPSIDRLYCSEDKWIGEKPVCISLQGVPGKC